MSTKHHFAPMEREYHDAFTCLRLMRRIEREYGDPGDYYDLSRDNHYWDVREEFESLSPKARRAARRSLSMRVRHDPTI